MSLSPLPLKRALPGIYPALAPTDCFCVLRLQTLINLIAFLRKASPTCPT